MSIPWGRILGTAGGAMIGQPQLGYAAGSAIDGYRDSRDTDKVNGVPTPRDGTTQGEDYRGFLDGAFPGTTAWERLGANSPMGAISSAEIGAKNAAQMQSRELANRSEIAHSNNRASVIAAMGGTSPMAAMSALDMLEGGPGSDYDTTTAQSGRRTPSEIERNTQQAQADQFRGRADRERSKVMEAEEPALKAEVIARKKEAEEDAKYAATRAFFDTAGRGLTSALPLGAFQFLKGAGSAKTPRKLHYLLRGRPSRYSGDDGSFQ